MIILIDFDGTCVTHDFPRVGKEIGAAEVLKKLVAKGRQLILFTMRSDMLDGVTTDEHGYITDASEPYKFETNVLHDARNWFMKHDIPLFGVNENPTQHSWTGSPKPYGHLIIDDTCLGIPLKFDQAISNRPFVDWPKVELLLKQWQVL